jgi:hypothetical protein
MTSMPILYIIKNKELVLCIYKILMIHYITILGHELFITCQKRKFQSYIGLLYGRYFIYYYYVDNFKK